MALIRGLAKCQWPKRRLGGGGRACRSEPRVASIREAVLIRLRTYRGKRACAKPIGIALAFLGQCDDSLSDDVFRNKPTTVAKHLARFFERGTHRPSVIGSEYRVSNTGKGYTHRALSGGSATGLSATGAWGPLPVVTLDYALLDMMSVSPRLAFA